MATERSTSPQIADPYAPLEQLALRALKRYGEMSPSTVEGEDMPLFIEYANAIIDDIHTHPYWDKGITIPYYIHQTDVRSIPDHVIVTGLLFRYALDKGSKKAGTYQGEHYARLNALLSTRKFGVGAEFELKAVDYKQGGVK